MRKTHKGLQVDITPARWDSTAESHTTGTRYLGPHRTADIHRAGDKPTHLYKAQWHLDNNIHMHILLEV